MASTSVAVCCSRAKLTQHFCNQSKVQLKSMNMISVPYLDQIRQQRDGVAALLDEQRLVQGKNVGKDAFIQDIGAPTALDTAALLIDRCSQYKG